MRRLSAARSHTGRMSAHIRARALGTFATALLVGAGVASCGSGASGEQLTWCAENQDEVGRAAVDLGLLDDPLTFSQ